MKFRPCTKSQFSDDELLASGKAFGKPVAAQEHVPAFRPAIRARIIEVAKLF
jgi:hypothetical protein